MGALLSMPGCIGNVFWVRSWIWDFSPTHNTIAWVRPAASGRRAERRPAE